MKCAAASVLFKEAANRLSCSSRRRTSRKRSCQALKQNTNDKSAVCALSRFKTWSSKRPLPVKMTRLIQAITNSMLLRASYTFSSNAIRCCIRCCWAACHLVVTWHMACIICACDSPAVYAAPRTAGLWPLAPPTPGSLQTQTRVRSCLSLLWPECWLV